VSRFENHASLHLRKPGFFAAHLSGQQFLIFPAKPVLRVEDVARHATDHDYFLKGRRDSRKLASSVA
jgi:hypothetical protein